MERYIKAVTVAAPIGATLMKTGQTTSYRTGDDGDIEAGRGIDFFTLNSNNPFNNDKRFTDILGGQTYTNNIVIDWSTYNGTNVLGYYRIISIDVNWNTAIDSCLTFSIGSFTSGWRLPNINELLNLFRYSVVTNFYNYSPININYTGYFWSSTSTDATNAMISYPFQGQIQSVAKSVATSRKYIPVRTFTVSGTTLT